MSGESSWLETLSRLTTGSARFVPGDGAPYNPHHCLAIYYAVPEQPPTLELPTLLVGDVLGSRSGLGCTLLASLPQKPPSGSILIGVWDDIARVAPGLLQGLPPPPDHGYHAHIGRYTLLTARRRSGVVAGLQTLAQLLAQFEGGFLPSGRLEDTPVFPIRSLYYNPGRQHPRLQVLTRLLGVPFAFKGCRLHLRLDSFQPVGASSGPGRLEESEAAEFGAVCREYGIELVPHLPWLSRWGDEAGDRVGDELRRLLEILSVRRVGLDGPWGPAGSWGFAEWLVASSDLDGVVLSADRVLGLFRDLEGPADPDAANDLDACAAVDLLRARLLPRVSALEVWQPVVSKERLARLARLGVEVGVIVPTGTRGFATVSPAATEARLAAAAETAAQNGVAEFGYGLLDWDWGRLWEMELLSATATLILGWSGPEGDGRATHQATHQAARLVYGLMGSRVLSWMERLAELYEKILSKPGEEWLLGAAFGEWPAEMDPEAASREPDGTLEECQALVEGLRQLRRKLPRNPQTLELFDYGLDSLAALRAQALRLPAARREYARRTRTGDQDAGRAAREQLELLLEELRPFALRTERLRRERGILSLEADALARRIGRLERAHAELRKTEIPGPLKELP